MSQITEIIENVREEFAAGEYPMAKMHRKIEILIATIVTLEERMEKVDHLEKEVADAQKRICCLEEENLAMKCKFEKQILELEQSLVMKGRILDTLCEQCTYHEEFRVRTEPHVNRLLQEVGQLEQKSSRLNETITSITKKFEDKYFIADSNIDTLFKASVDRNKEYQVLLEKMKKTDKRIETCNEDIIGIDGTMFNYKRENEMLVNRVSDLYVENQSRDNGLDVLRLKLVDISDEAEEIKKTMAHILWKNKKYDATFEMTMCRMDELESAMKTVTFHWKDIRELKDKVNLEK